MFPYKTSIDNWAVKENPFLEQEAMKSCEKMTWEDFSQAIPQLIWQDQPAYETLYQKTWEMAYANLKHPTPENGFRSSYIDTAFNDCTFLWDTIFIVQFAKYARNAYPFIQMLDNFYGKQHSDGFICREIARNDGTDRFYKHDPASTGPNLFAWCEWEYYKRFGDLERIRKVFPALLGYHRWLRLYRTWPDGSYWSSGWGCGLDNSPRFQKQSDLAGFDGTMAFDFYHGHHTWADACLQQALSAEILCEMAALTGKTPDVADVASEGKALRDYIEKNLWDEREGFYFDRNREGRLSGVKTIASVWGMLSSPHRAERMASHFLTGGCFASSLPFCSLSRDDPHFGEDPVYWQGGVWAPTNYLALSGLWKTGHREEARLAALNCLEQVAAVFADTGTLWEYYNPHRPKPGAYARKDFVGWSGLFTTAIPLEFILGINAEGDVLDWQLALTAVHGVRNLPVLGGGSATLISHGISPETGFPEIEFTADRHLSLRVTYKGRTQLYHSQIKKKDCMQC